MRLPTRFLFVLVALLGAVPSASLGAGPADRNALLFRSSPVSQPQLFPPVPETALLPADVLQNPSKRPAVERYKQQFLHVRFDGVEGREWTGSTVFRPLLPSSVRSLLFRGVDYQPLHVDEFLHLVGEHTLADKYAKRRRVRWVTTSVGASGLGVGVILIALARLVIPEPANCRRDPIGDCNQGDLLRRGPIAATQWAGTGVAISGLILWITGAALVRRPPRLESLEGMADGYNQRLRERLGLAPPAQAPVSQPTAAVTPTVTVGPRLYARGAGVDAMIQW